MVPISSHPHTTHTLTPPTQALGVLLFKLCFMDTPFGDNPLAIVSAQYSIPEDSPYTQDLHNLIGETMHPPTHTHTHTHTLTHTHTRTHTHHTRTHTHHTHTHTHTPFHTTSSEVWPTI